MTNQIELLISLVLFHIVMNESSSKEKKSLEIRLSDIENKLNELLGTGQQEAKASEEDIQLYRKVLRAALDDEAACGINECSKCIVTVCNRCINVCTVCKVCDRCITACTVCKVCDRCITECRVCDRCITECRVCQPCKVCERCISECSCGPCGTDPGPCVIDPLPCIVDPGEGTNLSRGRRFRGRRQFKDFESLG
jgi:hypothetical protein